MSDNQASDTTVNNGRRQLLIGSGILGAAVTVAPGMAFASPGNGFGLGKLLGRGKGRGRGEPDVVEQVDWTVDQLRNALEQLKNDTFFSLIAFAVPGNDPWSEYQGVSQPVPGGIATRADLYLAGGINLLVPLPPEFMKQLLNSIGSYLSSYPMDIPEMAAEDVGENGEWILENLDATLGEYLDGEASNAVLVTLLLNLTATRLHGQVDGPFPSPFANLSWEQKAKVFEELENSNSWLKRAIIWNIPDRDYRDAAPGILGAIVAFLLRIGGFGSYNEFAVFDPANLTVVQRPLGWVLSQYRTDAPPLTNGSDDFIGYYQGRRSV